MSDIFHNKKCFMSHMGYWSMEELRFNQLKSLILGGKVVIQAQDVQANLHDDDEEDDIDKQIQLTRSGIQVINLEGTLMRAESSFGGTSTVRVREQLRAAARNPAVKAVLLKVDSPGGTVTGTDELAQEIANFPKTIHAHADGLMGSAAFWVGAQADHISASRTSEIGSLGTFMVVQDFSGAFEKEGIITHVITTGPFKGAGVPGSEITEAQLEDFQKSVIHMNTFFIDAVVTGRKMHESQAEQLFDGRTHIAAKALELGLIDEITSFEGALAQLEEMVQPETTDADLIRTKLRMAKAKRF